MEYCLKLVTAVVVGLPFFFWGTTMVVMEEVMPKAGAMFVVAVRLVMGGALILLFATLRGKKNPSGVRAWLSILLFGIVNGALFQGCVAEGLKRTTAGIGSVIIDSQPLTVAVLACLFYGEILGLKSIIALAFGIFGLVLIEVPVGDLRALLRDLWDGIFTAMPNPLRGWSVIWDSGEWWMLLAAQSMAVGTVMMRWVSKFSDPIMVIGWHMVLGGIPVLAVSFWTHDPAVSGHLGDLNLEDWAGLFYASVFGSSVATGLYFYNATRGSLTELSSLILLTPVFAAMFGYLLRNETLSGIELVGSLITLVSVYFVKVEKPNLTTEQGVREEEYDALAQDDVP